MEFGDFRKNYDKVEICNLTADALTDDTKHQWEVNTFEGNWIRGSTAGGCRNFIGETTDNSAGLIYLLIVFLQFDLSPFGIRVVKISNRLLTLCIFSQTLSGQTPSSSWS